MPSTSVRCHCAPQSDADVDRQCRQGLSWKFRGGMDTERITGAQPIVGDPTGLNYRRHQRPQTRFAAATAAPSCAVIADYRATFAVKGSLGLREACAEEATVLLNQLSVGPDLAAFAQVAHHVPMQTTAVLVAGFGISSPQSKVDGAADLLVE